MALNHFASRIFGGLKHFYSNHFGAARISDVKGPLNLWDSLTKVHTLLHKIDLSYDLKDELGKKIKLDDTKEKFLYLSNSVNIIYSVIENKIDETLQLTDSISKIYSIIDSINKDYSNLTNIEEVFILEDSVKQIYIIADSVEKDYSTVINFR